MQTTTYFLGANTAEGFRSHYNTLFSDRRMKELIILKGGAGCGKSTLMRKLSAAAVSHGCDVEEILCSSDPDSLDALIIPAAGLALVDGTAPHVVEPPLCGVGARYLDLGRFYDRERLWELRASLLALKEKNAACYPLCYSALQSARAASDGLRTLAATALPAAAWAEAKAKLVPQIIPLRDPPGDTLCRYTTAFTPQGCLSLPLSCRTLRYIRDSYGLAAPLLAAVRRSYRSAGHTTAGGYDPLHPRCLQSVLLPETEIGFVAVSPLFPTEATDTDLDLDALVEEYASPEALQQMQAFMSLREQAVQAAIAHLAEAKRHHDALEQLYRPAVDFAGLDETADVLLSELEQRLA